MSTASATARARVSLADDLYLARFEVFAASVFHPVKLAADARMIVLDLSELWALPAMLRLVLLQQLSALAAQVNATFEERAEAEMLEGLLLQQGIPSLVRRGARCRAQSVRQGSIERDVQLSRLLACTAAPNYGRVQLARSWPGLCRRTARYSPARSRSRTPACGAWSRRCQSSERVSDHSFHWANSWPMKSSFLPG